MKNMMKNLTEFKRFDNEFLTREEVDQLTKIMLAWPFPNQKTHLEVKDAIDFQVKKGILRSELTLKRYPLHIALIIGSSIRGMVATFDPQDLKQWPAMATNSVDKLAELVVKMGGNVEI